ncbi:MAG: pyruvate, phosphate dikinase [Actinobacteria bacterium]|nr:pyruvate, phosphate dikinase [Actinomycetota bacterium]
MNNKLIYQFSSSITEGDKSMTDLLGGKGANLAEMSLLGINVPPGFTVTTDVCTYFMKNGNLPDSFEKELTQSLKKLEEITNKNFDSIKTPLLLSVRSGGKISMPGMMDSILNIGINDQNLESLASDFKDEKFALDSYRRLIQMYGNVVLNIEMDRFEAIIDNKKRIDGVERDSDFNPDQMRWIIEAFKNTVERFSKNPFPQNPNTQLMGAIEAVFKSWLNKRAKTYRRINNIPDEWGTAANVQSMVFGNLNEESGTGVAFTRFPSTGKNKLYGEYLMNAQGEDVVAGIRTPFPIGKHEKNIRPSLEEESPDTYKKIEDIADKLEKHYKDVQDIEFTIEDNVVYVLQTRSAKRTAQASVKIAVDMHHENLLTKEEAINMVDANQITSVLHPQFKESADRELFEKGLNASPGAAVGVIVFDSDKAELEAQKGRKVILVRDETSPEDIHGMFSSVGILTTKGGMTSHAAVVARGMGKPCVAGAENLVIDHTKRSISNSDVTLEEGDLISIDGSTGEIFIGEIEMESATLSEEFNTLMKWCDEYKKFSIRANAETIHDTSKSLEFGADGIGLCRTEHMFFEGERILPMREMIMSESKQGRTRALEKIIDFQISDFVEIFKLMKEKPVTIRLLDPPMHEFLPKSEVEIAELGNSLGVSTAYVSEVLSRISESNPMLGHRGVRLGITYPEIYKMQVSAIFKAARLIFLEDKTKINPEIMIPLVMNAKEFKKMKKIIVRTIENLKNDFDFDLNYSIGTMIELPSAALNSSTIGESADFFSYGTNDLTQTTLGLSRDDSSKFLGEYVEKNIFEIDPFITVDENTVGKLVSSSVTDGRDSNNKIKIGVCGEHAGDPKSITFFNSLDIDYISCSPYRIPTARLAAAQAQISNS